MAQVRRRLNSYIDHIPRPAQEPVGYCWNATHYGQLSRQNLKKHGCISKHCPFLERYYGTAPDFWNAKKTHTEYRKLYKSLKKQYLNGKITLKQYNELRKRLEEEELETLGSIGRHF